MPGSYRARATCPGTLCLVGPRNGGRRLPRDCRADLRRNCPDGRRDRSGAPVTEIHVRGGAVHVATAAHEGVFDHLVVCAGLQSSLVPRMIGAPSDPEIIPFRGEYYEISPDHSDLIGGSCIPSQILAIPFWVCISPEALMAIYTSDPTPSWRCRQEGYRWSDIRLRDLGRTVGYPGMRKMARQHWRMGAREYAAQSAHRSSCVAPEPTSLP